MEKFAERLDAFIENEQKNHASSAHPMEMADALLKASQRLVMQHFALSPEQFHERD